METLSQLLKTAHSSTTHCFQSSTEEKFGVRDEKEEEPAFLCKHEEGDFKVHNPLKKPIGFWQVDHCTYQSKDHKRSDCALWDDQTFLLLELKANNTKSKQRRRLRKKAYSQLQSTLADIDQYIPETYEKRAITCFRFSNDFPATKTTNQDMLLLFEDEFQTSLEEGNTFTFQ